MLFRFVINLNKLSIWKDNYLVKCRCEWYVDGMMKNVLKTDDEIFIRMTDRLIDEFWNNCLKFLNNLKFLKFESMIWLNGYYFDKCLIWRICNFWNLKFSNLLFCVQIEIGLIDKNFDWLKFDWNRCLVVWIRIDGFECEPHPSEFWAMTVILYCDPAEHWTIVVRVLESPDPSYFSQL